MPQVYFSQFNVFPKTRFVTAPVMKMSLFGNNSQVYYKPKSLASGGVGTVRNSGSKGRRT